MECEGLVALLAQQQQQQLRQQPPSLLPAPLHSPKAASALVMKMKGFRSKAGSAASLPASSAKKGICAWGKSSVRAVVSRATCVKVAGAAQGVGEHLLQARKLDTHAAHSAAYTLLCHSYSNKQHITVLTSRKQKQQGATK